VLLLGLNLLHLFDENFHFFLTQPCLGTLRDFADQLAAQPPSNVNVKAAIVMSDNGSVCRSKKFPKPLRRFEIRNLRASRQWQSSALYPDTTRRTGLCSHFPIFRSLHANCRSG
jgi:hypothetical protein